jgi:hypothetical protein
MKPCSPAIIRPCRPVLAVMILCLSQLAGCRSCSRPEKADEAKGADADASQDAAAEELKKQEPKVTTAVPPILPEAEITHAEGAFKVVRAETKTPYPILQADDSKLYIGDRVVSEEGSVVEIEFAQGGKARLEGASDMMIGRHLPAEIVVIFGRVVLETEVLKGRTRRFKVQTPGCTFFHAGPSSEFQVARDGSTRIFVRECPVPEVQAPAPKDPKKEMGLILGCSSIVEDQEKPLFSGDLLTVDARLKSQVQHGYQDTSEKAKEWLLAADERFSKESEKTVEWFIKWTPSGIDRIDEMLARMENLRLGNKDAIQELKALRSQTKPETPAGKAGGDKAKKKISEDMDQLKLKLAENSKQMARLREMMLTTWYQLNLRWMLFQDLMTPELLARTGKDKSVLEAFFTSYDEKMLKLVKRRPRRKLPAKLPLPSIQKSPIPNLKAIKPVGPTKH